jgi:tetratricopeptide (TPR) repeat protein
MDEVFNRPRPAARWSSSLSATRPAADPTLRLLRRGTTVGFAIVVTAAFLLGLRQISDSDVWTHLAHGRALVAARGAPPHEPFTYPGAALPYYNTEWLFGVALYATYALGGLTAVVVLKAAFLALTAALLWRTAMLGSVAPGDDTDRLRAAVGTSVVLAALLAMRYRFVERPDVALMVFIAATVYALEAFALEGRRRALFLLVPMTIIWANVHPSVIVAAGPFAAVVAGGVVVWIVSGRCPNVTGIPTLSQLRVVTVVGVAALLASLVNPYGWDAVTLPFRLAGSEWFTQEVTELQRPRLGDHPIAFALGGLLVATLLLNVRRVPASAALLAAPFAWLALSGARFVFLLPLVVAPLLVRGLMEVLASASLASWRRPLTMVASGTALAVMVATGLAIANVGPFRAHETRPGVGIEARAVPEGALAYLDRVGVQGRVFNAFHFGGYIAWRDFPRRAPIIDGRAWVPSELVEEIHFARVYPAHLARLQAAYGFEAAVMDYASFAGQPLDEVAPGTDAGLSSTAWALVYWDDVALVYLRRAGPFAAIATRDEYRHLRPANGAAALARALQAGLPTAEVADEIARNERDTGSAMSRTLAGTLALHRRDWDGALARFASVHDGPGRLHALQVEALAAGGKGDFAHALASYDLLLAETDDATVAYYAGMVALNAGRNREAIRYLERARRRQAGLIGAYPPLLEAYRRQGDADAVRKVMAAYEDAQTRARAGEHAARGRALLREGRGPEAAGEFTAALALDGADARAQSGLASAYALSGRFEDAAAAHRIALKLDPRLASAHFGLALLDERRGDAAAARRHFDAFVRLEPRSYAAWQVRQRLVGRAGASR